MKDNNYEGFLVSKNNIIREVNKDFLNLIGYIESELVGKTLVEIGKLLRTDSQVDLEDIEVDTRIFIFTKELVAIEGRISSKIIDNGAGKIFSFEKDAIQCANQSFNLANQLGSSRENAVVILNYDNLIVINNNDKHLDFHEPPYNKKMNTIGRSIVEILPKDLYDLFNKMKNYVIETGNLFYAEEIKLKLKTLGETYWNVTLVPIAENEKNKYLILYISNETEKVLNREALKQRNEELETIIENINDEIIIFDKDFNITNSNKKTEENMDKDYPYLKSFNNLEEIKKFASESYQENNMFDGNDQPIPYENLVFKRVARGEVVSKETMRMNSSRGSEYVEVSGYPMYDQDGDFIRGIMIYGNIDDRIRKEESRLIKRQNEVLAKVIKALGLKFVRCTYPELEIIGLDSGCFTSFKDKNNSIKSKTYPIGENYFSIYPGDEEDKRKELDFYLIEKGESFHINYTSNIVDGEERFYKTINQPILGLNDTILEIIFITVDITDEVQERNKLEETLEMQNQIFATISHELKTPLSVIFSAVQLIERILEDKRSNIKKEDISKKISIIKQNCYRFTKLINNIIDLSRMESGFYKLKFTNKNIVEIVEDIVDSVRTYVENAGLRIIFDTEIEEKIMAVDVDKMERIILNLISNAVKFSPKGETIYINIEDKEDFILILVRDCGIGIGSNDIKAIFDRYKKVDNSLIRNAEGSGLGLALVQTIINSVGGEISVESELGKGSLFTIKIPVNILAESEVVATMEEEGNRRELLNIEFSDIYTK